MKPRGVFIAGTDTGVGKTITAAALCAALARRGVDVRYLKPVGTEAVAAEGAMVNPDAVFVKQMAGLHAPLREMNPLCFKAPLAPHAAAEAEGAVIDFAALARSTRRSCASGGFWVVEGAGGVLVPLTQDKLMLDLMAAVGLPALVVGRAGLGTVNHTLLTIRALESAGVPVAGFCFCGGAAPDDPSVADNPELVRRFSGAAWLGHLPRLAGIDPEALARAGLALGLGALPGL